MIRWTNLTDEEWTGHGSGLYEGNEWSSATKIQWTEDGARYEDTTGGEAICDRFEAEGGACGRRGTKQEVTSSSSWCLPQTPN